MSDRLLLTKRDRFLNLMEFLIFKLFGKELKLDELLEAIEEAYDYTHKESGQ